MPVRPSVPILIPALCLGIRLFAQDTPGTASSAVRGNRAALSGTVRDDAGHPVVGALVFLPSAERRTTSDGDGTYRLRDLPVSTQTIVVRALGRRPATARLALAAGDNAHDVTLTPATVTLVPVIVSGLAGASDPTTPLDVASVEVDRLRQTATASLGRTLEKIPGVAAITTGPMAGNPVLRGMSQGQVRLVRDGLAVESFQGTSRWTPPVSFGSVERVEVIRGPASVMYGSSAMGGAINLLPRPLPRAEGGRATLDATLETQYFTNNDERYLAADLAAALPAGVGARLGLSDRTAGNFATARAEPYPVTGRRHDPLFTGRLPFTNYEQRAGFAQLGYSDAWGQGLLSYDGFDGYNNFLNTNGRPTGVRMANHEVRVRSSILGGGWVLKPSVAAQELRIQRAASAQLTYETARAAAGWDQDLARRVVTGRLEAEHAAHHGVNGRLGVEAQQQKGTTRLSRIEPSSRIVNFAAFAFEEWRPGRLTLSGGVRYDHRRQRAAPGTLVEAFPEAERTDLLRRSWSVLDGSLGAGLRLTDALTWLANVSTGFRAPSTQDLYTDENRPAFGWLEGNPRLRPERSTSLESTLRLQGGRITAQVTAYRNAVRDYTYLENTGRTRLVRNEARLVYRNAQADAVIRGLEAGAEGQLIAGVVLEASFMGLRSHNLATGEALPLMPADQLRGTVRLSPRDRGPFRATHLRLDGRHVLAKRVAGRTEPFAEFDDNPAGFGLSSTPAYHVVEAGLSTRLMTGAQPLDLSLDVHNLLDTPFRDFLDTQKGFALAQGRSLALRVSVPLDLMR